MTKREWAFLAVGIVVIAIIIIVRNDKVIT